MQRFYHIKTICNIFLSILLLCFVWASQSSVFAVVDPQLFPNNRFGIHIVDPNDLEDAAKLVNSSGGLWGYVTMVIQENDRNHDKWQGIFDVMRRLKLIPIIRIATVVDGDSWKKPDYDATRNWVEFLNGLNWPVKNRYVMIFNEPNHAKEWGNSLEPEEYGKFFVKIASELKGASEDFFILNAGFDVSAQSDGASLDAKEYIRRMITANPEFLVRLDGWASHSYPNPAFSASPYASGRGSIQSFYWELEVLRELGLKKELPVFITETGWIHNQGLYQDNRNITPQKVGLYLKIAMETIWDDPRVIAVTPFLLNYQGRPFDNFSWKKIGSSEYYSMYYQYQEIKKISGQPMQDHRYSLSSQLLPDSLVVDSSYSFTSTLVNSGQSIFDPETGYELSLVTAKDLLWFFDSVPVIEPSGRAQITVHLKTPKNPGEVPVTFVMQAPSQAITLESKTIHLIPPPSMNFLVTFGLKKNIKRSDAKIILYDENQYPVQTYTNLSLEKNTIKIPNLSNVIPDKTYRIVLLVPGYLPRQIVKKISENTSTLHFEPMWPVDLDNDGALTYKDAIRLLFASPYQFIESLF